MSPADTSTLLQRFFEEEAWLQRLARRLVRDDAAAQDLVQDTWAAALENPPQDASRPRAWLTTVATRLAAKRQEKLRPSFGETLEHHEAAEVLPDLAAVRFETGSQLRSAVDVLAEPLRSTILLRFQEELPQAAIAERMGVSVRTVRSRIQGGLEAIRTRLGGQIDGSELDGRSWAVMLAPLIPPPAPKVPVTPDPSPVESSLEKVTHTWTRAVLVATAGVAALTVATVLVVRAFGPGSTPDPVERAAALVDTSTAIQGAAGGLDQRRPAGAGARGTDTSNEGDPPAGVEDAGGDLATASVGAAEAGAVEFTQRVRILLDGSPPEGFEAHLRAMGQPRSKPDLVPIDATGAALLGTNVPGEYRPRIARVYTEQEQASGKTSGGTPTFFGTSRVLDVGSVDDPFTVEVWTGELKVRSQEYDPITLEMFESAWTYKSYGMCVDGWFTFVQVPEGSITIQGQHEGPNGPALVEVMTFDIVAGKGYELDLDTGEILDEYALD